MGFRISPLGEPLLSTPTPAFHERETSSFMKNSLQGGSSGGEPWEAFPLGAGGEAWMQSF